jgi:hypothetical protein
MQCLAIDGRRPVRSTQRALLRARPAVCIVDFRAEDGRLRGWQEASLPVELCLTHLPDRPAALPRTAWRKEDKHDERVETEPFSVAIPLDEIDGSATRIRWITGRGCACRSAHCLLSDLHSAQEGGRWSVAGMASCLNPGRNSSKCRHQLVISCSADPRRSCCRAMP